MASRLHLRQRFKAQGFARPMRQFGSDRFVHVISTKDGIIDPRFQRPFFFDFKSFLVLLYKQGFAKFAFCTNLLLRSKPHHGTHTASIAAAAAAEESAPESRSGPSLFSIRKSFESFPASKVEAG